MLRSWQKKCNIYWTIWALGYHRVVSFQGKTIDLKIFLGPLVITMWR